MKIEIINRQNLKKVNVKQIKSTLRKVFRLLEVSSKKASFVLCDNAFIKKLNKKYFKKSSTTDVISFPLNDSLEPDYLGEVVVSVEKAVEIGKDYGNNWQREVLLYIIHGILHLMGYDDNTKAKRKIMENRQEEILNKL